jgi:hypothetical protein
LANPELDNLFRNLLASNRGPGYGVSVTGAAADLSVIDVELRFIAGRSYCCAEPGCHVGLDNAKLLRLAAQRSVPLPESVTVRWHCHVAQGARLEVMKSFGRPVESEAYDFVEIVQGGSAAG